VSFETKGYPRGRHRVERKSACFEQATGGHGGLTTFLVHLLRDGEVVAALAERTGLDKKQIAEVFAALGELIARELGKRGPGQFAIPGLLKIKVVRKPATKARSGRNPFTGEPMTFKARPARNVVRGVPLKALKELV
jgi:nucleoid DNA-binding protein